MSNNILDYFTDSINPRTRDTGLSNIRDGKVSVLGFSGKKGSGKDTISGCVKEKFEKYQGIEVVDHPFAYALKYEATEIIATMEDILSAGVPKTQMVDKISELYNIPSEGVVDMYSLISHYLSKKRIIIPTGWTRTQEIWDLLRLLGTEIRQADDPYYWVKQAFDKIVTNAANGKSTFVNDVRFLHEVEPLILLGAFVVRVDVSKEAQKRRLLNRDGVIADENALNHRSEIELDLYTKFHYRFDNSQDGGLDEKSQTVYDIWKNSK